MTDRLILHIGDFKSGSTAIQSVLATRKVRIPGQRLIYPGRRPNHIWVAESLMDPPPRRPAVNRIANLVRNIQTNDAALAVLSAEHFTSLGARRTADWLAEVLPEQETEVICYVRPHAEYILSSYAERVKLGAIPPDFDRFIDHIQTATRLKLTQRYQNWRTLFKERFTLRPMVRPLLFNGSVVDDFLNHIGRGARFIAPAPEWPNRSLCLEDLHFVARAQAVLKTAKALSEPQRHKAGNRLQRVLLKVPHRKPTRLHLNPAQLAKIRASCRADAAALDAAFFEGTPMTDALEAADRLALDTPLQAVAGRASLRQAKAVLGLSGHPEFGPLLKALALRQI